MITFSNYSSVFPNHSTQIQKLTLGVNMKSIIVKYLVGLHVVILLTACGEEVINSNATDSLAGLESGSAPGSPATDSSSSSDYLQITGAGIKGPLAFADVKIFALDLSFPDFYDNNSPIASTITNEYAQINGLYVPRDIQPPYVLTVGGNNAIDLNTGTAPVISTLTTVITEDMLADNRPIYATPLTTSHTIKLAFAKGSRAFPAYDGVYQKLAFG